ncbi:DUF5809 family protein [Natronomonas sp. EA1]|uniref:DUF5809 family protein n=1 Tax=Natronomonas sp. EA1 TaxID=3421655 RepID=UPI003EC1197F
MHVVGEFTPSSIEEARERYETLGPAAQTVVREVARAMEFDREEYGERVDADVVATARDALFASLLAVHVGSREEFEAETEGLETHVIGNENVDRVAWHAFDGECVAATFHEKEDAAVATLRRQAYGRLYRERL